jgi:hypothetical protein
MARRPGSGNRWLALAAAAAALCGPAPCLGEAEPARSAPARERAPEKDDKPAAARAAPAPDTELLDWLGRYADAADDIDPLALDAATVDARDGESAPEKRP